MGISSLPEGASVLGIDEGSSKKGILLVQLSTEVLPEQVNEAASSVVGDLCEQFADRGARAVRFVSSSGRPLDPMYIDGTKYPWKRDGTTVPKEEEQ